MKKLMYGPLVMLAVCVFPVCGLADNTDAPEGASYFTNIETEEYIYPTSRGFIFFDLAGAVVDGGNDVDDGSTPNITTADNIPVILWDNSGETTGIQFTFPVPPDYSSGLRLNALVSSGTASGAPAIDWRLWSNATSTGFDSSATEETVGTATISAINTSCEVLTMTVSTAGEALMTSGSWITLEVFNGSTHASANTELKGLYIDYIRKM